MIKQQSSHIIDLEKEQRKQAIELPKKINFLSLQSSYESEYEPSALQNEKRIIES